MEHSHQEHSKPATNMYACPMHPEVTADKPGMCPKCHMALEKVKQGKGSGEHDHASHDKHAGHNPNMFKQKFWFSLVLSAPTLLFSPAVQSWLHYSLAFTGSRFIPAFFGTIIFIYGGMVFLRSARGELAAKQPGMMTLISMAIIVAFGYSFGVTFGFVSGMDFWWELATLITIMLLGHWLEMASISNAQNALSELARLLPDEAELIDKNGNTKKVPVSELVIGSLVLVRPGAQVPIDGKVVKGASNVNEAMLTGESHTIKKIVGANVYGGTINTTGSLTIEVSKISGDTALAGIMKLVEDAQASKSKTQVLADKAAYYLTFVSLAAALLTIVGWTIAGESAGFILQRVVTVLVIACPHALGLAIPLVTAISTTLAAKNGLLIRQRIALESARSIDVVLFDKTGTLTKGELGVVDVIGDNKAALLSFAIALENESEHPIARAIVQYGRDKKVSAATMTQFTSLSGLGVSAKVNGKSVYAGGPNMLKHLDVSLTAEQQSLSGKANSDGKSTIYIFEGKKVIGSIQLADVIREESKEAVTQLLASGIRVAMLTGDSHGVAAWVAGELGITEFFAEVLPENKASTVKRLQKDGSKVAMVGDGVNDAPALTQADIGIAIGAGTDVAIESAGIVLASSDPRGVLKVIKLSRATYRKMLQNLVWATGYNAIAIPLAAGVTSGLGFVLSPAVGAVLMSLSTIVVAVNAQFLRRIKL